MTLLIQPLGYYDCGLSHTKQYKWDHIYLLERDIKISELNEAWQLMSAIPELRAWGELEVGLGYRKFQGSLGKNKQQQQNHSKNCI